MTEHATRTLPSPRAVRDGALALIAAGNTLESVAGVYNMPVDALRRLVALPVDAFPAEAAPARPTPAWHRFPGTVVYRYANDGLVVVLGVILMALVIFGCATLLGPRHPRPAMVAGWVLALLACTIPLFKLLRAGQVKRFEMHPDMIVRYTRGGRTVLRYADIVAASLIVMKVSCYVELFTRHGVGMKIVPSLEQMKDPAFKVWFDAIPRCPSAIMQSMSMRFLNRFNLILLVSAIALFVIAPALVATRDAYKAKSSLDWPTADAIVTESASLSGGGKRCPYGVRIRYAYMLEQQRYVGHNYRFGGVCTADAKSIASANPVGKHIRVHYRPGNPAESVIVPGSMSFEAGYAIFAAVGTMALLFAFYRIDKRK